MKKIKQLGKLLAKIVMSFFDFIWKFINKFKVWFNNKKRHEKFIIGGVSLATLLVLIVCCFTIDFSRILGNVYDVKDIGSNIDDINIGDTINYTGNGYSDWQVLNINKEDNTIDIVSNTSTESVTITCEAYTCNNFYDTLQRTADKYLDDKYAVSARTLTEDEWIKLRNTSNKYWGNFWIAKKSDTFLYTNYGSYQYTSEIFDGYLIPILEFYVDNINTYSVGDVYNYSLNDVNEWLVLYVNTDTISVVPKNPRSLDFKSNIYGSIYDYYYIEYQKYWDSSGKVKSRRLINRSDLNALNNIDYGKNNKYKYYYTFSDTWRPSSDGYSSSSSYSSDISGTSNCFFHEAYYYDGRRITDAPDGKLRYCLKSYATGFRPVVTIKYSGQEKQGKEKADELKIGDYVNYSANAYNNWRVLSIDKENNTVDIISGGIVKNISLEGKDDYEKLSIKLQKEVDKYKKGKDVISARSVEVDDFDNLRKIKDTLSVRYFINNKTKYRARDSYGNYMMLMAYVVGIAHYDSSISDLNNDWAILEYEEYVPDTTTWSTTVVGSYKYTAGLRPVVTLKLSEVEEAKDLSDVLSSEKSNDSLSEEQEKANVSAHKVVEENEIKESIIDDKCECDLDGCCTENYVEDDYGDFIILIIINILLTILAFVLSVLGFVFLLKKIREVNA